jgi:hypothetical protein
MKRSGSKRKATASQSGARRISVADLRRAIQRLPADKPVKQAGVWYLTQKEHWLGWLKYYNTKGAYGRIPGRNRDARYAYNHAVNPGLLEWLVRAAGVNPKVVRAARAAAAKHETMMAQSGAIRRVVPWEAVRAALWPKRAKQAGSERKT